MTDQRSIAYLSELHRQIDNRFDLEEIRILCFNLGIDYENIPGDRKSAFVRNLILSMARQGRLQELVDKVQEERPGLSLADVPADFDLPQPMRNEDIREVSPTEYNMYVQGDYVGGDKIEVGNISNSTGVAIGPGASASVTQQTTDESRKPLTLTLFGPFWLSLGPRRQTTPRRLKNCATPLEAACRRTTVRLPGLSRTLSRPCPLLPNTFRLYVHPRRVSQVPLRPGSSRSCNKAKSLTAEG